MHGDLFQSDTGHGGDSLLARLERHARDRADAIAYQEASSAGSCAAVMTYGQLWRRSQELAAQLRQQLPGGSAVMIRQPNTPAFPVAFMAVLTAGCRAFPVSTASSSAELSKAASLASVDAILDEQGLQLSDPASDGPHDHDAGLILQSSGTTGAPGIVFRDAAAVDAVAAQMAQAIGFTSDDHVLCAIPLCHSYGIEHGLLAPLYAGSAVHLCPGMDLPLIWKELCSGGITLFPATPSIYEMLSSQPPARLGQLRAAYSAGAPLPRAVFDAFRAAFGVRIAQLYGATEVGSVTYNDPRLPGFDPMSVGLPMRGVQIRICRTDDLSADVATGEEGQVSIRAASMLREYLGRVENPLVDGFFPTADLGRLDHRGRLTITGRLKLLVDIGGLKVNPMEVEQTLLEHPAVSGCVVVPIRQSSTIWRLKAVITARTAADPPAVEELRQFARERLSPHKVPRLIEIRPSLPRSSTGKILRHLVTTVLIMAMLWLMPGCAGDARLPKYPPMSDVQALHILAQRGRSVHAMTGQGALQLTDKNGQTVRLQAAIVMRAPRDLHLRAWKFGQMVFDLTSNSQGVWIFAPHGDSPQTLTPAVSAAQFSQSWSLLTFFDAADLTTRDRGGQLIVRQDRHDGQGIVCDVDRPTLTPRRYQLLDRTGHVRFTLEMDQYAVLDNIPWPRRMKAVSSDGTIELDLSDVELNGDIPAGAFVPPPHAQRLP